MSLNLFLPDAGAIAPPTTTTLASQGGLLVNIDSATGDIASTTSATWLESNTALGMYNIITSGASNEADTAVTRTGNKTLKLSTTNATGLTTVVMLPDGKISPISGAYENGFVVKPSTKYKLSCWVKTNNVAAASTYINFTRERNASGTIVGSNTITNTLSGTNDWTLLTCTKTTAATAVYSSIFLVGAGVAGNTGDAWFDVKSMTLEEVVEPVANSLTSSSPSLVSFTAVGSTDNIDQAQLTINSTLSFSTVAQYQAQQFTPTKSKFTGVILQKISSIGNPSGTMTFQVVNDSAGSPGTTVFATASYTSAQWEALTNNADFTINLPCNLTAGTPYWLKMSYSVSSLTDYPRINSCAPSAYSGLFKYGTDGITYGVTFNGDAYFKTLYYKPTTNFKASQNNSTVSISADEDGFLEASKINLATGQYTFNIRDVTTVSGTKFGYIFSETTETGVAGNTLIYLTPEYQLKSGSTTYVEGIMKIKLPGGITDTTITAYLRRAGASYSTDGVSYTTMYDNTGSSTPYDLSYTISGNVTTLYIKIFSQNGGGVGCYFADSSHPFTITGTINTSSLSTLRNYPTNKDIIKQYTTTLGSATTTATYRATKWGFPAIEYLPLGTSSTGLVARYDMRGNGNDTSGNGYNLTLTGAPSLTTGRFGDSSTAYSLNGTTQYLSTPTINLTDIQGYTFCFWFNPVSKLTRSRPIASTTGGTISAYYGDAGGSGTNLQWFVGDGTTFSSAKNTASVITFGAWQFIAITYDKATGKLYKNGALLDTNAFVSTTINVSEVLRYGSNGSNYCEGSFGEMYFFNRALSLSEITDMYNVTREYQYLDIDTTATGSTVAFSELGTSFTTVVDGASLAITSTSTPSIWAKTNITANRLYLSSNDYNTSSDKDGSLKQSVVYQVKSISTQSRNTKLSNRNSSLKLTYG